MTTRGRKPTPTALRVLRGNAGKRALPQGEPKPAPARPECPPQLQGEARQEWERVADELEPLGLLAKVDRAALALYCDAWGRWVEATEALRQYGLVIKSPSGYPMQSPYLAIASKAADQMRLLLGEFGMSPASRTRVQATQPDEDDEFTRVYLRRGPA